MKNNIFSIASLATLLFLFSCNPQEEMVTTPSGDGAIVITATTGNPTTRIAFEDNEANGVKQTWEKSDRFLLYNAEGNYAATFTLKEGEGSTKGEFECTDGAGNLTAGNTYTAVYPAVDDPATNMPTLAKRTINISVATQKGNGSLDHIDGQCYMKASYTHSDLGKVQFDVEYVMMTVVMEKPTDYNATTDGVPASLTFVNDDKSTTLALTDVDWNAPLKAYLMVAPHSGDSRTLRFDLLCSNGSFFQKEVASDKAYESGKRYTAPLGGSNILARVAAGGYALKDLKDIPKTLNTWIITDAITETTYLGNLLTYINNAGRNISLVLPDATGIENRAFWNCKNLVSISFPKVKKVGESAFWGCSKLASISLPEVKDIGKSAFGSCYAIQSVSFPKAENIGFAAFNYCSNLTDISLPQAKTIGEQSFVQCAKLGSVSLPESTVIGEYAFQQCSELATVSIPNVESIGKFAFNECDKLQSFIGPKVTNIENGAFDGCSNLTAIDFPEVTDIGRSAFVDCTKLGSVSLPKATSIGQGVFFKCTDLKTLSLPEAKTIVMYAFNGCTALQSVSLPKVESLGEGTFHSCIALQSLEIATASSISTVDTRDLFAFVILSTVDLKVGASENSQVNATEKTWRGFGPFKGITIR